MLVCSSQLILYIELKCARVCEIDERIGYVHTTQHLSTSTVQPETMVSLMQHERQRCFDYH